ncbi:MAG: DUF1592 domain-containing protein, partial [Myxococcota bacterium]|nr:DUF1592 domain-containing protein [Myxococcota bacterium]
CEETCAAADTGAAAPSRLSECGCPPTNPPGDDDDEEEEEEEDTDPDPLTLINPELYGQVDASFASLLITCPLNETIAVSGPGTDMNEEFICDQSPLLVDIILSAELGAKDMTLYAPGTDETITAKVVRVDAAIELPSFTQSKALFNDYCTSCHQNSNARGGLSLEDLTESDDFIAALLIVPGAPDQSPLYQNLQFAGGTMPKWNNTWQETYTQMIAEWITQTNTDSSSAEFPSFAFNCEDNTQITESPLRRLTKNQYINTVTDLLNALPAPHGQSLLEEVQPYFERIPDDSDAQDYGRLDYVVSDSHVEHWYIIGKTIGGLVAGSDDMRHAFIPQCGGAAVPSNNCIREFIEEFGQRIFRRPLKEEEVGTYLSWYNNPEHEGMSDFVARFFIAPEFLYHLEYEGSEISNDGATAVYKLTNHELASRLSYQFWDTMPDATLFALADNGLLHTEEGFESALNHVLADPKASHTLGNFVEEWLQSKKIPEFTASMNPAFEAAFADILDDDVNLHVLRDAMRQEIRDLATHIAASDGSFADLFLSTETLTPDETLADIYGVAPYHQGGNSVLLPEQERAGILTRAAFHLTGSEVHSPIFFGARFQRRVLCNELESPDADLQDDILPPPFDPDKTLRERIEIQTYENDACASCHQKINPPGFAAQNYDALGRYQDEEQLYDEAGHLLNTFDLDTAVESAKLFLGDAEPIDDLIDLSHYVVESGKSHQCFTQQYYRYSFGRLEGELDGCGLEELRHELFTEQATLKDFMRTLTRLPQFQERRINMEGEGP